MKLLLDEAGMKLANAEPGQIRDVLEDLLDVLEAAEPFDDERVERSDLCYDEEVLPGVTLCDLLFGENVAPELADCCRRLGIAVGRMDTWDGQETPEALEVEVAEQTLLAPTLAWAVQQRREGQAVGCLGFRGARPPGPFCVRLNGEIRELYAIGTPQDRITFLRESVEVEDLSADEFPDRAVRAFPDLEWVNDVWRGLRSKKSSFFGERRPILVRHLAALNDLGAQAFHECPGGNGVEQRMPGVDLSPENGKARSHKPSIDARTVNHRGADHVFWWHTKITHDDGRIHFLHFPARQTDLRVPGQPSDPPEGIIAVGIFNDHCVLPNR